METIEKPIVVDVPVWTVYNRWTQFENFPQFMSGVEEMTQQGDKRTYWRAQIAGKTEEWNAEIVEQTPDQCVAWRSAMGRYPTVLPHPAAVQLAPKRPTVGRSLAVTYYPICTRSR